MNGWMCSVRVSNELGAGHPRTAKFSLVVAVTSSSIVGIIISLILIIFRDDYPYLFSNDSQVQEMVIDLTPLLALCIIINNIQPVLSGFVFFLLLLYNQPLIMFLCFLISFNIINKQEWRLELDGKRLLPT